MSNDPYRGLSGPQARAVRLALQLARMTAERDTLKQQLDHYERTCTCPARNPIQAPEKTDG